MNIQTELLNKISDILSRRDKIEARPLCEVVENKLLSIENENEISILHYYLFKLLELREKDEDAIKYLELPRKQNNDLELKFTSLFHYGLCLMRLKRSEDGLSAFSELLHLAELEDNDKWKIDTHICIGKFYHQKKDWSQAIYHFNEALFYAKKCNVFSAISDLYFWIGSTFLQQDKFYLALDNFKEAEEKAVDIQNELLIYRNVIKRCDIYIKLGEIEKVNKIIDRISKGLLTLK